MNQFKGAAVKRPFFHGWSLSGRPLGFLGWASYFALFPHNITWGVAQVAKKHHLKKTVAEALEIPAEVALDSVRIVLVGHNYLSAENHKGIIEYLPGKIVFKTIAGQAEVLGEGLTLAALKPDELEIEGKILAVCLVEEDAHA